MITAKKFQRFIEQHKTKWPDDLLTLAYTALRSLKVFDGNPPSIVQAMERKAPEQYQKDMQAIVAFTERYAEIKAKL